MKNKNLIAISGKMGSGKDLTAEIIQYLTSTEYKGVGDIYSYASFIVDRKTSNEDCMSPYQIRKFADKLKDIVCLLIGCTREQLEDSEFKNTELGEEWWYYIVRLNKSETLVPYLEAKEKLKEDTLVKLTPRLLLQLIGTECGRNIIHPNIWVNSLMREYKEKFISSGIGNFHDPRPSYKSLGFPKWIITDLRFENELEAVKARGGVTIRVVRPEVLSKRVYNKNKTESYQLELVNIGNVGLHSSETSLDNAEFDYKIRNDGTIEDLIEKVKEILIKEEII